jgi:hypothetical protein
MLRRARFGLRLPEAGDHRRPLAVLGLAVKFETDAIRIVEIDAIYAGFNRRSLATKSICRCPIRSKGRSLP